MVVIDTNTGQCFENLNASQVARIIEVNRVTVHRWQQELKTKHYQKWVVYLHACKV
jgi:DNA invertase Pin-like site-specific DNA recombinase